MSSFIIENNSRNVFVIQIFIKAGSAFEQQGKEGISHVLEHMMFKTKKHISVERLLMELNSLGGTFNAVTSKDFTCFYIKTVGENWKKSVQLLKAIVFQPHFLRSDLENEKKVIIEEFLQYEDDIRDKLFEKAYSFFLPSSNPYRNSIKGSLSSIKKITKSDLEVYYNKHYQKCMVYINCPKELTKQVRTNVMKHLGKHLGNISFGDILPSNIYKPVVKIISETKRSQNATIIMFKGYPYNDPKNITLEFLWDILTGSLNSLLMLEMREKRGLVYSMNSFNNTFSSLGLTGIYFTSSNKDIHNVLQYIFHILKRIKRQGINEDVLSYSKTSYINKLRYRLTNMDFLCERAMMRYYYNSSYDENYIIKQLKKVKNKNIQDLCSDVFDFDSMCVVSIGNYENPKSIESKIIQISKAL